MFVLCLECCMWCNSYVSNIVLWYVQQIFYFIFYHDTFDGNAWKEEKDYINVYYIYGDVELLYVDDNCVMLPWVK